MSPKLANIRAKIERAKEHIRDLDARICAFKEIDPYTLLCDTNTQPGVRIYRVKINCEIPIQLALIAGEAIQHLRSSLDHLAWQLVLANKHVPTRYTAFPLTDGAATFQKKGTKGIINGICPDAISIIESVQPYQTGYELLGTLQELNNIDKHRFLLIVAYGLGGWSFRYRHPDIDIVKRWVELTGREYIEPPVSPIPASSSYLITQDGAEVVRFSGLPPGQEMYQNFDFAYEISLGEPEIVQGKPIVPFLTELASFTDGIVSQFSAANLL